MKEVYVLKSEPFWLGNIPHWDGYWTGDTYVYQQEHYAVVDKDIDKAKKYKSLKIAERGAESLNKRVCNYSFKAEAITEE